MGLLDSIAADPTTLGLLSAGTNMMAASGPSRMPVNLGTPLSAGIQGFQGGIGAAVQMQQQAQKLAMLRQLAGMGMPGTNAQALNGAAGASGQPDPTAGGFGGVPGGSMGSGAQGGAAPAATAAPTIYGKTPAQLFQQGMMMNLAGLPGGSDLMKIATQYDPTLAAQMPTDATKMATQGGLDTAGVQAANLAALRKSNYIAPVAGRPGASLTGADGVTRYNLPAPQPGAMWATNPDGTLIYNQAGQPYQIGIAGAADAANGMAYARTSGEGSALPYSGVDAQGNPLPVTNRTAAATQGNRAVPLPLRNNNPGAVSPGGSVASYPDLQTGLKAMDSNLASYAGQPGTNTLAGAITKWVGSAPNAPAYIKDVSTRLGIAPNAPIDLTNPAQRQAIGTAIMLHENGPGAVFSAGSGGQGQPASAGTQQQPASSGGGQIYAAPQPGYVKGQEDLQGDLTKKWGALNEANSQAQNTVSYLQNIKTLAQKAATGQQADRLNYVNGLLSLAGDERATDTVTANNLLDKYSNQIVARLGTGGLGTDAARSILASAYPNAHMTQAAINEASDNLVGASQMTQAKARLLQPSYNARDPQTYNQKEMIFDQNADPRIWQYKNITDPAARQAFAKQVLQQDPQFPAKIKALEGIGAL